MLTLKAKILKYYQFVEMKRQSHVRTDYYNICFLWEDMSLT